MNQFTLLFSVTLSILPSATGQQARLYFIAGTPVGNRPAGYQTLLGSIATGGSVKVEKEFTSEKVGAEWITTDLDARKAVILSKEPDNQVIVLDLDTVSVTKLCPNPDGSMLVDRWLSESPSHGPMFVGFGTNPTTRRLELLGMELDSSTPCPTSFVKIDDAEVTFFVTDGVAGLASTRSFDQTYVALASDGSVVGTLLGGQPRPLGYVVPTQLFADVKNAVALVVINNRQLFGLKLRGPSDERFLVFRKSDRTWHKVPDPSMGRAFGSIVASSESRRKASSATHESAGRAEWRQEMTATGPGISTSFSTFNEVYPGALHLYDAASEKSYTITTNQGDSEVLLVENGSVYYRVGNRLYSAPIGDTSIGAATLLATHELIRDAHWAFIRH